MKHSKEICKCVQEKGVIKPSIAKVAYQCDVLTDSQQGQTEETLDGALKLTARQKWKLVQHETIKSTRGKTTQWYHNPWKHPHSNSPPPHLWSLKSHWPLHTDNRCLNMCPPASALWPQCVMSTWLVTVLYVMHPCHISFLYVWRLKKKHWHEIFC